MNPFAHRLCAFGLLLSLGGCSGPVASVDEKSTYKGGADTAESGWGDDSGGYDPYTGYEGMGGDPYAGSYGNASPPVVNTVIEQYTFEGLTLKIESDIHQPLVAYPTTPPPIRVYTVAEDGTQTNIVSQHTSKFLRPLIRFSEPESAFYFVSYSGNPVYGEGLVFEPTLYRVDAKGIRTKNLPRLVFEGPIPRFVSRYELNMFSAPGVSVFKVTTLGRVSRDEDETRTRTFVEHLRLEDFD